jgi:hypothetical protein
MNGTGLANLSHGRAALAIFPSSIGFGWVVFDGPLSPYRWKVSGAARGAKSARAKNERCLKRIEELLQEFRPGTLVLEAFEGNGVRRSARIQTLCRATISLASVEGVTVRVMGRNEIARCFPSLEEHTRETVASRTAEYLREIRSRLPGRRRLWESENTNMALMNATALLIAHYAIPAATEGRENR